MKRFQKQIPRISPMNQQQNAPLTKKQKLDTKNKKNQTYSEIFSPLL